MVDIPGEAVASNEELIDVDIWYAIISSLNYKKNSSMWCMLLFIFFMIELLHTYLD